MTTNVQQRRAPKQERSQRRVESILATTRRLVGQRGNDAVSMREIAAEAGVPVSSVYQYFPDKNALLRELISRYTGQLRQHMFGALDGVSTMEDFIAAVPKLLDTIYAMFEREPELAPIWSGVQANAVLRENDMEDTRVNAKMFAALACSLLPEADADEITDITLQMIHSAFFILRVAFQSPPDERDRLLREQKRVMEMRMRSLLPGCATSS